jgi:hypothetical protein
MFSLVFHRLMNAAGIAERKNIARVISMMPAFITL